MRIFIFYVLAFFVIGIVPLNGQAFSFFCADTALQSIDPSFKEMHEWLGKNIYEKKGISSSEAVHRLLSEEAMTFKWDQYPCIHLTYYFLLSISLKEVGAHEEAENTGREALRLDSILGGHFTQEILSLLASNAYENRDYSRAVHYYKLNYAVVRDEENNFSALGGLNNLGLAYLRLDSIAQAKQIFSRAIKMYKSQSLGPSTLQASLLDNLSDVALIEKDTLSAIRLLHEKDSVLLSREQDTLRKYQTWASLADLYLSKGEMDKVIYYLDKAEALGNQYSGFTANEAYELESIRMHHARATNNVMAVFKSLTKLEALRNKAREELINRHETEVDALHQYADFNVQQERALALMQIERKEQEQRYQRRLTLLGALAALIFLALLYIYFYYKQKANQHKIKNLEISVDLNLAMLKNEQLEKDLLKSNLEASEKELVAIAMESVRRKEWTKEIMEKIDHVLVEPNEKQTEGFKKLYFELVHQYQIQERLSHTHEHQELIQSSFLHKLRSNYPELSANEIDLCILLRLGLSGKEIAAIRNVDPESIRKAKYRLRHKMNIPTPEELKSVLYSY